MQCGYFQTSLVVVPFPRMKFPGNPKAYTKNKRVLGEVGMKSAWGLLQPYFLKKFCGYTVL